MLAGEGGAGGDEVGGCALEDDPAAVVLLGYLPYLVYSGTTDTLVNVFILLTLASMWNLLAGYAGLVSVGQQAFVGLGAYFVLVLAQLGVEPFAAIPLAALACAAVALPVSWLVFRLRGGYFAIATWVVADATATFGRRDYDGRWCTAAEVHAMSLANLDGEYARIVTTEEVLQWP